MDNFDKAIWGFAFSTLAIVVGWSLNELGQWIKSKKDDKRVLKVVLYNLLEVYFIFSRSDFDKVAKMVAIKVNQKIPEIVDETLFVYYQSILNILFKPELSAELKILQANYHEAIKALAGINPVDAFYLSGKTKTMQAFDRIQTLIEQLKKEFPNDTLQIDHHTEEIMKTIKPDIVNDILADLERDMRNIAWRINFCMWIRVIIAIKKLRVNANAHINKEIDFLFEKISLMIPTK